MKSRGKAIVANTGGDTLSFINLENDNQIETLYLKDLANYDSETTISLDSCFIGPYDLVFDGKEYIYCTNVYDNSVLKIQLANKKVIDSISVGRHPTCIRCFQSRLYVANSDSNSISVIDREDFSLIENIPVGEKPVDIEIDENEMKMYVANGNGNSIDIIDLNSEDRDIIKLDNNPIKMIIDKNQMYTLTDVNNGAINKSNISLIDLETYKKKDTNKFEGIFSDMLKINGSEIAFITNVDNGYLYRMDIERRNLLSKIHLKGMPNKLGWNQGNILFVSNISTNTLTVFDIDSNTVIDNIKVGIEPNGILILN